MAKLTKTTARLLADETCASCEGTGWHKNPATGHAGGVCSCACIKVYNAVIDAYWNYDGLDDLQARHFRVDVTNEARRKLSEPDYWIWAASCLRGIWSPKTKNEMMRLRRAKERLGRHWAAAGLFPVDEYWTHEPIINNCKPKKKGKMAE
jgi:hypothetical protein